MGAGGGRGWWEDLTLWVPGLEQLLLERHEF